MRPTVVGVFFLVQSPIGIFLVTMVRTRNMVLSVEIFAVDCFILEHKNSRIQELQNFGIYSSTHFAKNDKGDHHQALKYQLKFRKGTQQKT